VVVIPAPPQAEDSSQISLNQNHVSQNPQEDFETRAPIGLLLLIQKHHSAPPTQPGSASVVTHRSRQRARQKSQLRWRIGLRDNLFLPAQVDPDFLRVGSFYGTCRSQAVMGLTGYE
jgi:hypothetical protein